MNSDMSAEKELELINAYARSPMTSEQLYTFTVTLCDNEVDRDFECFTPEALEKMKDLFLGKTGISDHSMRSRDQAARIYHCFLQSDPTRKTASGEAYTALKAKAYMVRTPGNGDLIAEIEAGIKKEVSVSCSMNTVTCSVCGKNMRTHSCQHIKGKTYKGKLCYGILSEPTDAYEWSFVAVPAQRNAGVTKSFQSKEETDLNTAIDMIKSVKEDTLITGQQAAAIADYIAELEKLGEQAACYKNHLLEDIARFSLIIMPKVSAKCFTAGCEAMDIDTLKKFRDDMEKQAREVLPPQPQLRTPVQNRTSDNRDFII
ncbi:MAG: hypothetical protein ACI4GB_02695 [Acutalibacteraceae bacterium]